MRPASNGRCQSTRQRPYSKFSAQALSVHMLRELAPERYRALKARPLF